MNWLYAIVLQMAALHPGAVPRDHGEIARGAMLHLLRRGDETISTRLHNQNTRKPYTVSMLRGGKRGRDGALHFGEGDEVTWRFTLLWPPAFEAILHRYLQNNSQPHLRMGTVNFAVTQAYANEGSHPESGSLPVPELANRWDRDPQSLPAQLTFQFHTPTCFRNDRRDEAAGEFYLLPEPRWLFSTLRKEWNKISPEAIPDDFDDWVQRNVSVHQIHHFETRLHRIKDRVMKPGFVGDVTYRIHTLSAEAAWVHLLADFTFWRGVGYQTGAGMGQVRVVR